jgi:hypothetical protein
LNKRIGVTGGGISGSSIASFLSGYPDAEVTLFEKAVIGLRTTAESPAAFCLIDDSVAHKFSSVRLFRFKFYTGLEADEPGSTGFVQMGPLAVGPSKYYEMYVQQTVDLTVASGYKAEYWHDHAKIHDIIADLRLDAVLGGGWSGRRLLPRGGDLQHPRGPGARPRGSDYGLFRRLWPCPRSRCRRGGLGAPWPGERFAG